MKLIFNLLAETSSTTSKQPNNGWIMWVFLIGLCVIMFVVSSRSRKKQQQQVEERLNALKPGDRISTIGLIQGVIEEIYDDGIILISTGSDDKKSYLTIERNAIYRTIPELEPIAEENAEPVEAVENQEGVESAIEQLDSENQENK